MISVKDIYGHINQLIASTEAISWSRFYNFLMGNSILILAWATIYSSAENPPLKCYILIWISVIGVISGIIWSDLGRRTRLYVDLYVDQAKRIEDLQGIWDVNVTKDLKPHIQGNTIMQTGHWWSSSTFVLKYFPLIISLFFLVLFVASIRQA